MLKQIRVGNGEILDLNDFSGATKDQLLKLINERNGYLNSVHLDREAFLNLLELQKEGVIFSLRGANLSNIDLSSVTYPQQYNGKVVTARIHLSDLDLSYAILNDANLNNVIFDNCDMRDAKARNAHCHGTQFIKCKVARLNLADATGLTPKQIFKSPGRSEAYYGKAHEQMIAGFVQIMDENKRAENPNKTQQFASKFNKVVMSMFGNETKLQVGVLFIDLLELRVIDTSFDDGRKTRRAAHTQHKALISTRIVAARLQDPTIKLNIQTTMPSILPSPASHEVLTQAIKIARDSHFVSGSAMVNAVVGNGQRGYALLGELRMRNKANIELRRRAREHKDSHNVLVR